MTLRNQLVMAVSALVLTMGGISVSGQGAVQQCASEECACEEALKQNTVEALEEFLRKYPQISDGDSACAALAVPPEEGTFDPEGQDRDDGSATVHPDFTLPEG